MRYTIFSTFFYLQLPPLFPMLTHGNRITVVYNIRMNNSSTFLSVDKQYNHRKDTNVNKNKDGPYLLKVNRSQEGSLTYLKKVAHDK